MLDYSIAEAVLLLGNCCCVGKSISHMFVPTAGEHRSTGARLST